MDDSTAMIVYNTKYDDNSLLSEQNIQIIDQFESKLQDLALWKGTCLSMSIYET